MACRRDNATSGLGAAHVTHDDQDLRPASRMSQLAMVTLRTALELHGRVGGKIFLSKLTRKKLRVRGRRNHGSVVSR